MIGELGKYTQKNFEVNIFMPASINALMSL